MSNCGTHYYANITATKKDAIIQLLKDNKAIVHGNNPWTINTQEYGIILEADWDENSLTLSITVKDKDWYVPCSKIWDKINDYMKHISQLTDEDVLA